MKPVIVLDAGHGGHDPGAVDGLDELEKDFIYTEEAELAYDIARRVQKLLKLRGYSTLMTRRKEQFKTLRDRVRFSDNAKADIFVSIHLNASSNNKANGFEVFSCPGSSWGPLLRDEVLKSLEEEMTEFDNRGAKEARFFVIRFTKAPAILIECGFITNPEDEKLLNDPDIKHRFAQAITRGILNYFTGGEN